MNILYYISNISRSWGGVYQYALSLIKSLLDDKTTDNQFFIYILTEDENYAALTKEYPNAHLILAKDIPTSKDPFLAQPFFPYNVIDPYLLKINKKDFKLYRSFATRYNYRKLHSYKQEGYVEISFLDWTIKKNHIDIIHCPLQLTYTTNNIPSICTMHDVQELHFPQFFTSAERARRAVTYKNAIDQASAVIVSYEHIKKDIINFFAKPSEQIHVCLIDMKDLWFEKFTYKDILELKDYKLPQKFILYPAATWEHKNHIGLLKAIHYLKQELKFDIHLVTTGHKNEFYQTIEDTIKDLNLEQNVSFLGIVSDQVLYSLYHQTTAVVVPTLYEAGSFPLMESILMNIPVICSNVTSLPATINESKFIFDPLNPKDMGEKIYSIVTSEEFIRENKVNSKIQADKLINNRIAEKITTIYKQLKDNSSIEKPSQYK